MQRARLAVLAALLAGAPEALAQVRPEVPLPPPPRAAASRPPGWLAVSAGPFAAFDRGQSVGLAVDYGYDVTPARLRGWRLEAHLVLVAARPSEDTALFQELAVPVPGVPPERIPAGVEEARALVVSLVPVARLRRELAPGFAVELDGGAGLYQTLERYERDETFLGRSERTKNVTGIALHAAAGVALDLSPRTRLVFRPFAFDLLPGSDWSAFSPRMGLAFRL